MTEARKIAECPFCEQGGLYGFCTVARGTIYLHCEECERGFRTPAELAEGRGFLTLDEPEDARPATDHELFRSCWRELCVIASKSWGAPSTEDMEPFAYRSFWDVPRLLLLERVTSDGTRILLESSFRDDLDDYEPEYRVLRVRAEHADADWTAHVVETLGSVPVGDVQFDVTCRACLDAKSGHLGALLQGVLAPLR